MAWLAPSIGYIVTVALLGITSKTALRTLSWQDLLLWVVVAYLLTGLVLVGTGATRLAWQPGSWWAIAGAVLAVSSLVLLSIALAAGDASKVVPVTSAYPALTLLLSALFLSEHISAARVAGML